MATIAFFFRPLVALASPRTLHHFFTRWLSRCQMTKRHASSIRAVRNRAFPCLVIGNSRVVAPLALTPARYTGQAAVLARRI